MKKRKINSKFLRLCESFGIEKLDEILKGGIPERSVVLVEGSPGIGKDVLAYHFIYSGLKERDSCAFVSAGVTVENLKGEFAAYGFDLDQIKDIDKLLVWIDASSVSSGSNVVRCDISELYTISSAIKKFLSENRGKSMRLVFSILSPILMSNDSREVYNFLLDLKKELIEYSVTSIFLIEEGMHDPQTFVAIEQLCDGVINMRAYEKEFDIQTMLRIKKMRTVAIPLHLFQYKVSTKGLAII